jgi:CRP-like cAMP-binding protein
MSTSRPVAVPPQVSAGNHLLAAMTRAERELVLRAATRVDLPAGTTLYAPGDRIGHVFLPESGLVSLIADMEGEDGVEVGLIGREGLVGVAALLGGSVAEVRALVQVAGTALRVEVSAFATLAEGSPNLRGLVRRHTAAMLAHVARNAACNAAHPLERRTARWLLSVADRVGPGFALTQDLVAIMLGARRPTVNQVLKVLREAGLIRCARGQIAISDRAGLERACCSCYAAQRALERRLFPGALGQGGAPEDGPRPAAAGGRPGESVLGG